MYFSTIGHSKRTIYGSHMKMRLSSRSIVRNLTIRVGVILRCVDGAKAVFRPLLSVCYNCVVRMMSNMDKFRNKCADEMILHMVINEGLTVTIKPSHLQTNAVEFQISQNGRHSSILIDQSLRNRDVKLHHDMECHAIAECYHHFCFDPINDIMRKNNM